jgi:pyruvate/2-oxoglutarate/acetoin dehydrogenase E1 component
LLAAIRNPDPVLFFEPKKVYRAIKEDVPEDDYVVPLGKARVVKQGSEITIVTWGAMLKTVMEALEETKYDVEVIDLQSIKPFDEQAILASAKKTGRVVIVHEAPRTGGWGAEIAARIQEKALLSLKAPVVRVTGFDVPFPYFKLENEYLPGKDRILDGLEQAMRF